MCIKMETIEWRSHIYYFIHNSQSRERRLIIIVLNVQHKFQITIRKQSTT